MNPLTHRRIVLPDDRDYVLERHCRINYECDCEWARRVPYEEYRQSWFSMAGQTEGFLSALAVSMQDSRTIAEILLDESGQPVGYLWVPFTEDADSGFRFAEVQDIYVEVHLRRQGIASGLYRYAEDAARKNGAKVLRAGTGCGNLRSMRLHEKLGYSPYRVEYEKLL